MASHINSESVSLLESSRFTASRYSSGTKTELQPSAHGQKLLQSESPLTAWNGRTAWDGLTTWSGLTAWNGLAPWEKYPSTPQWLPTQACQTEKFTTQGSWPAAQAGGVPAKMGANEPQTVVRRSFTSVPNSTPRFPSVLGAVLWSLG